MEILKVSAKSNVGSVAGALANTIRSHGEAELQAVGAGSINQSVKAIAVARGFLASNGQNLVCSPSFMNVVLDGEEKTGMKFYIKVERM